MPFLVKKKFLSIDTTTINRFMQMPQLCDHKTDHHDKHLTARSVPKTHMTKKKIKKSARFFFKF